MQSIILQSNFIVQKTIAAIFDNPYNSKMKEWKDRGYSNGLFVNFKTKFDVLHSRLVHIFR